MDESTAETQLRYDRIAPAFDLMEAPFERFAMSRWRRGLWSRVEEGRILEAGVGTGKNMPYYPENARVTAVDLSDGMLARAQRRVQRLGVDVVLLRMDVQRLAFRSGTFDGAVATFVFCSVPDPILGLRELGRVVKPSGQILLLEHVRIDKPGIGIAMDALDPFVTGMVGDHINRRTVENVKKAGLEIEQIVDLGPGGLVKLIVGRTKPRS